MAYDEALAERVRDLLAVREAISERKMFSGIAFMIAGNMGCAVTSRGLMVRLDPDDAERAMAEPHVGPMEMNGKPAARLDPGRARGPRRRRARSPAGSTRAPTSPPRFHPSSRVADDPAQWWRDAVVYQIYPRSFQDSDGDGVGDLPGIASRLDHLEWLGVDAIWLSPIYPSPGADLGYDVSDYAAVDPLFGSLADLDALIADCHRRGIRVLLDLVASHTSIEHPWFREHPDWYVWADGDRPPNNWLASFGGPAWSSRRARPGAGTCTRSIPSSPTSTGATPRSARRSRAWSASGASAGSTASASTRSSGR